MFRKVEGNQDDPHVKDHLIDWLPAPGTNVCSLNKSVSFTTALGKQFKSLTAYLFTKLQFIPFKISFKSFLFCFLCLFLPIFVYLDYSLWFSKALGLIRIIPSSKNWPIQILSNIDFLETCLLSHNYWLFNKVFLNTFPRLTTVLGQCITIISRNGWYIPFSPIFETKPIIYHLPVDGLILFEVH